MCNLRLACWRGSRTPFSGMMMECGSPGCSAPLRYAYLLCLGFWSGVIKTLSFTTAVCVTTNTNNRIEALFFVCVAALLGGWGVVVRSDLQLFTYTFVRIWSRHACSGPPPPSPYLPNPPRYWFSPEASQQFWWAAFLSFVRYRETGKFQGTVVASGSALHAGNDFGRLELMYGWTVGPTVKTGEQIASCSLLHLYVTLCIICTGLNSCLFSKWSLPKAFQ